VSNEPKTDEAPKKKWPQAPTSMSFEQGELDFHHAHSMWFDMGDGEGISVVIEGHHGDCGQEPEVRECRVVLYELPLWDKKGNQAARYLGQTWNLVAVRNWLRAALRDVESYLMQQADTR